MAEAGTIKGSDVLPSKGKIAPRTDAPKLKVKKIDTSLPPVLATSASMPSTLSSSRSATDGAAVAVPRTRLSAKQIAEATSLSLTATVAAPSKVYPAHILGAGLPTARLSPPSRGIAVSPSLPSPMGGLSAAGGPSFSFSPVPLLMNGLTPLVATPLLPTPSGVGVGMGMSLSPTHVSGVGAGVSLSLSPTQVGGTGTGTPTPLGGTPVGATTAPGMVTPSGGVLPYTPIFHTSMGSLDNSFSGFPLLTPLPPESAGAGLMMAASTMDSLMQESADASFMARQQMAELQAKLTSMHQQREQMQRAYYAQNQHMHQMLAFERERCEAYAKMAETASVGGMPVAAATGASTTPSPRASTMAAMATGMYPTAAVSAGGGYATAPMWATGMDAGSVVTTSATTAGSGRAYGGGYDSGYRVGVRGGSMRSTEDYEDLKDQTSTSEHRLASAVYRADLGLPAPIDGRKLLESIVLESENFVDSIEVMFQQVCRALKTKYTANRVETRTVMTADGMVVPAEPPKRIFIPKCIVWLAGPVGSGKTSVASYVLDHCSLPKSAYIDARQVALELYSKSGSLTAEAFYESLLFSVLNGYRHRYGIVVDGFLENRQHARLVEFLGRKLKDMFSLIRFVILAMKVDEKPSVERQVRAHMARLSPLMTTKPVPISVDDAKELYVDSQTRCHEIVTILKKAFSFQEINANGDLERTRENTIIQIERQMNTKASSLYYSSASMGPSMHPPAMHAAAHYPTAYDYGMPMHGAMYPTTVPATAHPSMYYYK